MVTSQEKAHILCNALVDAKAEDIVILNVKGLTLLADSFVLCTGNSTIHIRAIADTVQEKLRESLKLRTRQEGTEDSNWVVLDYGDVVLHIFSEERREFYDLERLWADAERVEVSASSLDRRL